MNATSNENNSSQQFESEIFEREAFLHNVRILRNFIADYRIYSRIVREILERIRATKRGVGLFERQ